MAKSSALGLAMLCVVLVMSPITVRSNSQKEIILYAEVIRGGPRANTILVAGPGFGSPTNDAEFGKVFVCDCPLRETIDVDSPVVGSTQGLRVVSSLNGDQVYFSQSVMINGGKYKIGTLQAQGTANAQGSGISGELVVPAGTDAYRFMGGYVDVKTVRYDPATTTAILRLNFFIKEFDD